MVGSIEKLGISDGASEGDKEGSLVPDGQKLTEGREVGKPVGIDVGLFVGL